jgi:hypothetical protein
VHSEVGGLVLGVSVLQHQLFDNGLPRLLVLGVLRSVPWRFLRLGVICSFLIFLILVLLHPLPIAPLLL